MDSSSQTDKPPQETSQALANFVGTCIALLTLIAPILAIASFSSPANEIIPSPPPYPIFSPQE
ncbi:MAG: hypothetical protein WBA57_12310 [Elainellaceae cyanobacterium]